MSCRVGYIPWDPDCDVTGASADDFLSQALGDWLAMNRRLLLFPTANIKSAPYHLLLWVLCCLTGQVDSQGVVSQHHLECLRLYEFHYLDLLLINLVHFRVFNWCTVDTVYILMNAS